MLIPVQDRLTDYKFLQGVHVFTFLCVDQLGIELGLAVSVETLRTCLVYLIENPMVISHTLNWT